ncbi:MAG: hypothetical protein CMI26_08070 [Opitutae bacterium]|nr:hypothetical protein [Opitutae bacterium]|tara:strand:+ start:1099 stop:1461 length:363 start_codon:yes stop_codon:yes gene_type:complete
MNNDARFFFCLCGFAGFVLFFSLGWILTGNAFDALLRGSIGCLVLGVGGRILLGTVLRSLVASTSTLGEEQGQNPAIDGNNIPPEIFKSNPTPEALAVQASAQATTEAAAGVEPGVDTSA